MDEKTRRILGFNDSNGSANSAYSLGSGSTAGTSLSIGDLGSFQDFGSTNFTDWFFGNAGAKEQATRQSYLDTMEYLRNQASAREQRAWEQYMSNTQVQRAMADLKAAGLNPWLAVQSAGFGGSIPSGAAASSTAGQVASGNNSSGALASIGATAFGLAKLIQVIAKVIK